MDTTMAILIIEVNEMSRLVIFLSEPERDALRELAEFELRSPPSQALLIIRSELERLGLIPCSDEITVVEKPVSEKKSGR